MIELIIDGHNKMTLNDDGTIDVKSKDIFADNVGTDNIPSFVNIIDDEK